MTNSYGIYISGANPATVKEVTAGIVAIISLPVADKVKLKAIDALQKTCSVSNTSVANCNITMKNPNEASSNS